MEDGLAEFFARAPAAATAEAHFAAEHIDSRYRKRSSTHLRPQHFELDTGRLLELHPVAATAHVAIFKQTPRDVAAHRAQPKTTPPRLPRAR